jgi:hypothetical protein
VAGRLGSRPDFDSHIKEGFQSSRKLRPTSSRNGTRAQEHLQDSTFDQVALPPKRKAADKAVVSDWWLVTDDEWVRRCGFMLRSSHGAESSLTPFETCSGLAFAGMAVTSSWCLLLGRGRNCNGAPLEIPRKASHLEIYLPLGNAEGSYELRVTTVRSDPLVSVGGNAKLEQRVTVLRLALTTPLLDAVRYVLQIRRLASEWASFPLEIR